MCDHCGGSGCGCGHDDKGHEHNHEDHMKHFEEHLKEMSKEELLMKKEKIEKKLARPFKNTFLCVGRGFILSEAEVTLLELFTPNY